jgi:hypothetical protein
MIDGLKATDELKSNNLFSSTNNNPLVIMDAGIASEDNIDYLKESNYEYLVVSRRRHKEFDDTKATTVKTDSDDNTIVRVQKVINEETNEIELYCHSKPREAKEDAMAQNKKTKFIDELEYLKAGLTIRQRTKIYEKVLIKIGRLKEKYSSVAQYYEIITKKNPEGENAISLVWKEKVGTDNKTAFNGVYCLRTNNSSLDEKTLWKAYTTLTDLEAVFKSLKSELGLRPIFHQKGTRVDGHLFITILVYSIIHTIRYKLKAGGINYCWNTIRDRLSCQIRNSTQMRCEDGRMLYIRKSSVLNEREKEIYDALGLKHQAGKRTKTYV